MDGESPFKIPTTCNQIAGGERCGYCGSMSVDAVIKALKTPRTRFSGADWKYGWPHKFYIDAFPGFTKFYNSHLEHATDEQLAEFSELSKACLGIEWSRHFPGHEGKLTFFTVPGRQWWGVIGPDGKPNHDEMRRAAQRAQHAAPGTQHASDANG